MWIADRMLNLARAAPLVGVLSIALIAPAAIALGQSSVTVGDPIVVVSSPLQTAVAVATRANGLLIAPGRIASVALVQSDAPGFIQNLYAEGAWLVLSGKMSKLLCTLEYSHE